LEIAGISCHDQVSSEFCVVRTVRFGVKLYNDQRNAQGFNLFIHLLLPYMFRAFFSPSSEAGVQLRQWFNSPVSEGGLKESPKHVNR
jgi:hypothetical protein